MIEFPKQIGDTLGRGIARDMLRRVDEIWQRAPKGKYRPPGVRTLNLAKKSAMEFIRGFPRELRLDAVASPDYLRVNVMSLENGTVEKDPQPLLMIVTDQLIWPANRPPKGMIDEPQMLTGTHCVMPLHGMQRCIQRGGVRSYEEMVGLIGKAANWAGIGIQQNYAGPFMVPVERGLMCLDTIGSRSIYDGRPTNLPMIKTFIGLDQMSLTVRRRWQRLVDTGCLENTPRAARIVLDIEPFMEAWAVMADLGGEWKEASDRRQD